MKLIAVTGTNGKTTTVELLRQMLSEHLKVASLGTLGLISGNYTDFEPRIFNADGFCEYLEQVSSKHDPGVFIFEAYSTALSLNIYPNQYLDIAILTNIREDHLDFHGSKQHYILSKMKLFSHMLKEYGTAIFCLDDEHAVHVDSICRKRNIQILTYGYSAGADLQIRNLIRHGDHSLVTIYYQGNEHHFRLPFSGELFVQNWLGAFAGYIALTGNLSVSHAIISSLYLPPGRKELIARYNNAKIYVDYAHNADGFRSILQTLRRETINQLHVVFGCGGNRDRSKRLEMGCIARELANITYLTSDNPRDEDPEVIIRDILAGCPSASILSDRRLAIEFALDNLQPGDTLVVTGKGHEKHQEIADQFFLQSDKQIILNWIRIKNK